LNIEAELSRDHSASVVSSIEEEKAMHRVTQCKAWQDYQLWLKFDDGLEGSVFLGNLLEVNAFRAWRDVEQFCRAAIDPTTATVVWDVGIQLDPDILHEDLLSIRGRRIHLVDACSD
jgi:hypothetical protein